MSHDPTRTIDLDATMALDASIKEINFGETQICVLFGYHQSDIGKAELIARLGVVLGGGSQIGIIKFDGFLNTNISGRHPSRIRNDFVVYRRFHKHVEFGGPSLILSGPLLIEFFTRFGESHEHLAFKPHVSKYFIRRVYDNWIDLGSPNKLLIEIGGNIMDPEVQLYVIPAMRLFKCIVPHTCIMILVEAGYNREVLKTRPVNNALDTCRQLGLNIDTVFVKMHPEFPRSNDYGKAADYIASKILENQMYNKGPNIICVPFYPDMALVGYTEFLIKHKNKIFR